MAEPEELILEGAHFATRVARDVWRRYGTSVPEHHDSPRRRACPARDVPDGALPHPIRSCAWSRRRPSSWLSRVAHGRPHHRGRRTAVVRHGRTAGRLPPALPLTTGGQEASSSTASSPWNRPRGWCVARRMCSPASTAARPRLVPAGGSGGDRSLDRRSRCRGWCPRWLPCGARARAPRRVAVTRHARRRVSNERSARCSPPIPWRHRSARADDDSVEIVARLGAGGRLRDAGRRHRRLVLPRGPGPGACRSRSDR